MSNSNAIKFGIWLNEFLS